jgi:hypothetical protein
MAAPSELDRTIERMLASETFEPNELTEMLMAQGHGEAEVVAAVDRVQGELAEKRARPAHQQALVRRKRGVRLVRLGIFTLAAGLIATLFFGGGTLQLLLVIAVGGALSAAGFRALKHG